MNDDTALREQLLAAEMQREMGEITDDDFTDIERDLLARMREIKDRREGGSGPLEFGEGEPMDTSGDGRFQIEATVSGDFHEARGRASHDRRRNRAGPRRHRRDADRKHDVGDRCRAGPRRDARGLRVAAARRVSNDPERSEPDHGRPQRHERTTNGPNDERNGCTPERERPERPERPERHPVLRSADCELHAQLRLLPGAKRPAARAARHPDGMPGWNRPARDRGRRAAVGDRRDGSRDGLRRGGACPRPSEPRLGGRARDGARTGHRALPVGHRASADAAVHDVHLRRSRRRTRARGSAPDRAHSQADRSQGRVGPAADVG